MRGGGRVGAVGPVGCTGAVGTVGAGPQVVVDVVGAARGQLDSVKSGVDPVSGMDQVFLPGVGMVAAVAARVVVGVAVPAAVDGIARDLMGRVALVAGDGRRMVRIAGVVAGVAVQLARLGGPGGVGRVGGGMVLLGRGTVRNLRVRLMMRRSCLLGMRSDLYSSTCHLNRSSKLASVL